MYVYTTCGSVKAASSTRENDRQIPRVNIKLGGGARKSRKADMVVNMHNGMEIGRLDATRVNDGELYGYGYNALVVGLDWVGLLTAMDYLLIDDLILKQMKI